MLPDVRFNLLICVIQKERERESLPLVGNVLRRPSRKRECEKQRMRRWNHENVVATFSFVRQTTKGKTHFEKLCFILYVAPTIFHIQSLLCYMYIEEKVTEFLSDTSEMKYRMHSHVNFIYHENIHCFLVLFWNQHLLCHSIFYFTFYSIFQFFILLFILFFNFFISCLFLSFLLSYLIFLYSFVVNISVGSNLKNFLFSFENIEWLFPAILKIALNYSASEIYNASKYRRFKFWAF